MFSYNNSYHRTIKTTSLSARHKDQQTLWIRQYGDAEKKKPKLSENDFVRVSLIKKPFSKGVGTKLVKGVIHHTESSSQKPAVL